MSEQVHISSLVVMTRPEKLDEVRAIIEARGGEIPAVDPDGKMVVVLETDDEAAVTTFANELAVMPGVLSANLIFHQVDEMDDGPFEHTDALAAGGKP